MKRLLLASILPLLILFCEAQITAVGGEWTTNASWDCNCQPGDGDVVIIPSGVTITISNQFIDLSGNDLTITIESGGELALIDNNGSIFTGQGRIRFGGGTVLNIEAGGQISSTSDNFFVDLNGIEICNGVLGCFFSSIFPEYSPIFDDNPQTGPATISSGGTVPIELASFEAKVISDVVRLEWATSFEENFSHFEIEYANDLNIFEVIGAVDGVGQSLNLVNYSFDHSSPILGKNYYRLKAVDLDDSYEYFGPLVVEYNGDPELLLYPNPVANFQFNADINFQPERTLRMTILDHSGRIVLDQSTNQAKNQIELPPSTASGLYLIVVSDGELCAEASRLGKLRSAIKKVAKKRCIGKKLN